MIWWYLVTDAVDKWYSNLVIKYLSWIPVRIICNISQYASHKFIVDNCLIVIIKADFETECKFEFESKRKSTKYIVNK